ncbi:tryptophan--tRNA ligase [Candidatus Marinamargulisbacteria bacterium SCGC AG-414-C22]|nr:tryptophan--tRNA ligase [Candidatus Marinamargulisbacteria bacterium SCGC AG-414-C22]
MKRILTGIKPTGLPHIGNYFGAIQPALSSADQFESFYFIADYHALTAVKDAHLMRDHTLEIAAAWLALGLDPQKTMFYKQSDIPEIFEFCWILSCCAAKGLLNRAHAYKAAVDDNLKKHHDMDRDINHGLYSYPVLMAADILLFHADLVPVGVDQKQHIEIARDIATVVNKTYGDILTLPEPAIQEETKLIPGIDGLKMSKNYNNTIPLFLPEKKLRKRIMQIVTDSTPVEDSKDPGKCHVFAIFKLFLNEEEQANLRKRYQAGGVGYGTIKQELFETMLAYFKDARSTYESLMEHPEKINDVLVIGQQKARLVASQTLSTVKRAIGILA